MGASARAKARRRGERAVRAALDAVGVTERARAAYLGLRREDVQSDIRARAEGPAPWSKRPSLVDAATAALATRGYDLGGIKISVEFRPGPFAVVGGEAVQLPPSAVFMADAAPEAVEAAERAAGARLTRRAHAAPLQN